MKKKIIALCLIVALAATAVIGGTLAYFTDTESVRNEFTVGNVDITLSEPNWDFAGSSANLMPGIVFEKDPTITVEEGSMDSYVFLKLSMNKYVSLVNLMGVDAYKNNIGGLGLDGQEYPGFITFVDMLANDNALRAEVLGRWFKDIKHSDWKVMNLEEIKTAVGGAATPGGNPTVLEVVLGYIGSADDTMSAGDSVTFMTGFGMPDTVTQSMFDGEDAYYIGEASKSNFKADANHTFKMTFTAYAIQADGIADIDAAYNALFK